MSNWVLFSLLIGTLIVLLVLSEWWIRRENAKSAQARQSPAAPTPESQAPTSTPPIAPRSEDEVLTVDAVDANAAVAQEREAHIEAHTHHTTIISNLQVPDNAGAVTGVQIEKVEGDVILTDAPHGPDWTTATDVREAVEEESGVKPLRTFISVAHDELARERDAVRNTLNLFPVFISWQCDESPASEKLANCDLHLLLLGQTLPAVVAQEFERAQAAKKITLVFARRSTQRNAEATALLARPDLKPREFSTTLDLRLQVILGVCVELIAGFRKYRLSREQLAGLIFFMQQQGVPELDLPTLPAFDPTPTAPATIPQPPAPNPSAPPSSVPQPPSPAPHPPSPDSHAEPKRVQQLRRARVNIAHELITIPAGEFLMGTSEAEDAIVRRQLQLESDWKGYDDEKPQHRVYLPTYQISKYPVTNAQFAEFVRQTGYQTEAEKTGSGWVWTGTTWKNTKGANWQHPRGAGSDIRDKPDHPVVQVSWHDVVAYAEAVGMRLPSEAEWEKAAAWDPRQKQHRIWPWGNQWDERRCNIWRGETSGTTPVTKYPSGASAYGVMDMVGNAREWCADGYDANYYKQSPHENPQGPATGTARVLRGGSWGSLQWLCRGAYRSWNDGAIFDNLVGFRYVRAPIGA